MQNETHNKLRIIFAGTPEIARIVLQKLIDQKFNIDLVLTQPDRPSGRGKAITASVVKQLAITNNIEVYQPESFKNNPLAINKIKEYNPDIIIVVAYGLILPQELLDIPKIGCVNMHVSLLPRWRGASPIQHSIINGDSKSGVTIMKIDAGLDTGDILLQQSIPLTSNETSLSLHNKLALLGSNMLIEYLTNYNNIVPSKQDDAHATYAPKIEKADAKINWRDDAIQIERKIRSMNPVPVAFTTLNTTTLIKIWQAESTPYITNKPLGSIIIDAKNKTLLVVCGNGSTLSILELQTAGKTRQNVAQFLVGHQNLQGKSFDIS